MIGIKDFKVHHVIKSHPEPFAAVWSGEKTHEIRFNDRDYRVGQYVRLVEWVPSPLAVLEKPGKGKESGRVIDIIILYLRRAPRAPAIDPYGLQPGFCVFDFLILQHFKNGNLISRSVGQSSAMTPPPFSTMANPEDN